MVPPYIRVFRAPATSIYHRGQCSCRSQRKRKRKKVWNDIGMRKPSKVPTSVPPKGTSNTLCRMHRTCAPLLGHAKHSRINSPTGGRRRGEGARPLGVLQGPHRLRTDLVAAWEYRLPRLAHWQDSPRNCSELKFAASDTSCSRSSAKVSADRGVLPLDRACLDCRREVRFLHAIRSLRSPCSHSRSRSAL